MLHRCQCRSPKTLFFCRFPPPSTGETIGSQLVYDLMAERLPSVAVEALGVPRSPQQGGRFRPRIAAVYLRRLMQVRRQVLRERVHSFYFVPASSRLGHLRDMLLLAAVRPHVCRVVAHVRSGDFARVLESDRRFLRRWFVSRIDAFVFLADVLAARAASFVPAGQRFVVPNTIDQEVTFSDQEAQAKIESRLARRQLNVVFISNMHRSKGYRDLADALCQLQLAIPWRAQYIGAWPSQRDRQQFEAYLAATGKLSSFVVHGPIQSRATIKSILAEADVFVLPTYYPVEAQPRSIIEALNAATPVIATHHASIPEYVVDGENGYLVEPQLPRQIAQAIEALADPDNWCARAMAARRMYSDRFQTETVADRLAQLLTGEPAAKTAAVAAQ